MTTSEPDIGPDKPGHLVDDTELVGRIAWAWMEADGYPSYGDLERDALDRRAAIAVAVMRQALETEGS